jgi:hypothetical protein
LGSFQAAYGKLQEWTAGSQAAQRRLAQRAAQVSEAVDALSAAGSCQQPDAPAVVVGASVGQAAAAAAAAAAAPHAGPLLAAGQVVAEQMAGLQQLMAAEAGKHRTEYDESLKVGRLLKAGSGQRYIRHGNIMVSERAFS